jgi:hypothetical protein
MEMTRMVNTFEMWKFDEYCDPVDSKVYQGYPYTMIMIQPGSRRVK